MLPHAASAHRQAFALLHWSSQDKTLHVLHDGVRHNGTLQDGAMANPSDGYVALVNVYLS